MTKYVKSVLNLRSGTEFIFSHFFTFLWSSTSKLLVIFASGRYFCTCSIISSINRTLKVDNRTKDFISLPITTWSSCNPKLWYSTLSCSYLRSFLHLLFFRTGRALDVPSDSKELTLMLPTTLLHLAFLKNHSNTQPFNINMLRLRVICKGQFISKDLQNGHWCL